MPTILIVDDDSANRAALGALLSHHGYDLLEAADSAAALEQVRAARPDLVIADILMPTIDGFEFVRQVRADRAIAQTPVVFYSATYLEHAALALARECGVEHVLTKPARPREILGAVAAALDQRAPMHSAPPADTFVRDHTRLLTDTLARKVQELEAANRRLADAAERAARLQAMTAAFSEALTPEQVTAVAVDQGTALQGARCGLIALLADDQTAIEVVRTHGYPPELVADWRRIPIDAPTPFAEAARTGEAIWIETGTALVERYPQLAVSRAAIGSALVALPLIARGRTCGVLSLSFVEERSPSAEERALILALAQQCAQALERARLFEQVRVGRERLQHLSRQFVRAQEDERRRLARELHDEIGQALTAAQLNLQALLSLRDPTELPARLEDSLELIEGLLQQVRALSLDLRPSMLDDLGLAPALRWYLSRQAERAGFEAQFLAEPSEMRCASEIETACFRIAQETLTNIVRHAQAQLVSVELRQSDGELRLVIRDDGVGFDVGAARGRAARGASLGLLGMRERALLIGGQVTIESAPGQGATVSARFPLPDLPGRDALLERRTHQR
jgi:signal transduction histidine kinase